MFLTILSFCLMLAGDYQKVIGLTPQKNDVAQTAMH